MKEYKILACIVLYNQKYYESKSYNSLIKYFECIIIDNSPIYQERPKNRNVKEYLAYPDNIGISKAYNVAAQFAKTHGYKWIILCDQDTLFPSTLRQENIRFIANNPNINLFVPKVQIENNLYLSPVKSVAYFSKLSNHVTHGIIDPSKYAIINSGLMISIKAFFEVGGYNENIKVDFADFQFIERYAKLYETAYITNVTCKQSFSNEVQTIEQKLIRFKFYYEGIKNYIPSHKYKKIYLYLLLIKRIISLMLQGGGFKPIKTILTSKD